MKKQLKSLAIAVSAMFASASNALAATTIEQPEFFFTDVGELISKALRMVMVIGALLVFMYLIWGGMEWITSGGDKGKTESARNKITAAIVGLIVLAASWAILMLVLSFIGVDGGLNTLFETAEL